MEVRGVTWKNERFLVKFSREALQTRVAFLRTTSNDRANLYYFGVTTDERCLLATWQAEAALMAFLEPRRKHALLQKQDCYKEIYIARYISIYKPSLTRIRSIISTYACTSVSNSGNYLWQPCYVTQLTSGFDFMQTKPLYLPNTRSI
jgi:hypothetical protein